MKVVDDRVKDEKKNRGLGKGGVRCSLKWIRACFFKRQPPRSLSVGEVEF